MSQRTELSVKDIKEETDSIIEKWFPMKNDSFELVFKKNIAFSMTLSILNQLIKIELNALKSKQILELIHSSFVNKWQNSDPLDPFDKLKEFLSNLEDRFNFPTEKYKEFIDYIKQNISFKDTADLFHLKALRFTMNVDKGQS